jgi:methionine-gamma-lyase
MSADRRSRLARPIHQTSTFPLGDDAAAQAAAVHPERYYTRYGNPNVTPVEAAVAALEGTEAALAVGSGMAAVTSAVWSNVAAGDHVIAQRTHYTATLSLLTEWLPRFGVAVTQVDGRDPAAFAAAWRPETRLVVVETPVNPTMELTDLAATAALARSRGAVTLCDNTFASPANQRPASLGIDLVVHSATKYLNGHHDVTAGVVCGSAEAVAKAWEYARVHGPVLHPFEAWLLERGLATFTVRMAHHNRAALAVAEALAADPRVAAVHYPGLPSFPQHDLARRQMPGGFGGMLSFEVAAADAAAAYERALALTQSVRLATVAVSLGGTDTLVTHPASMVFAHQTPEELAAAGVPAGLVRVSVGLEEPDAIVADLLAALPPSG